MRGWHRMAWMGVAVAGACHPDCPPVSDTSPETGDTAPSDTPTDTPTDTPAETDPPGPTSAPALFGASGVRLCADPSARDVAPFDRLAARSQELWEEGAYRLEGGAIAVADFTGDNKLDLFLPSSRSAQFHHQRAGVVFNEGYDDRFAGIGLSRSSGVAVADVDADEDLDLLVVRYGEPVKLLINDSTGFFLDRTEAAGLVTESRLFQSATFGDLDDDGDLDLFLGVYGPKPPDAHAPLSEFLEGDPSYLFENQGDGRFVDVSDRLPPSVQTAHTFQGVIHDFDNDGRDDLLVVNDFGWARPSVLLWNRPEGLVEDDGSAGFAKPFAGMGAALGDLNADGIVDVFQSSWRESSLLVSAAGAWWESASSAGLLPDWDGPKGQVFGWGTELVDIDADGDLDLPIAHGYWDEYGEFPEERDALFIQTSPLRFEDQASLWGVDDPGASRGLVAVDINDDGYPDLARRILGDRTPMDLSRCGSHAWLKVRTKAPAPNTFAIGARVRVIAGGVVQDRWVRTGGTSLYAAYHPEVLFGLGDTSRIDRLEILWPDGATSWWEDVDARQTLEIVRLPDAP